MFLLSLFLNYDIFYLQIGKKEKLGAGTEQDELNEEFVEDRDKLEEESIADEELRPLKKSKSEGDTDCTDETSNGESSFNLISDVNFLISSRFCSNCSMMVLNKRVLLNYTLTSQIGY